MGRILRSDSLPAKAKQNQGLFFAQDRHAATPLGFARKEISVRFVIPIDVGGEDVPFIRGEVGDGGILLIGS